MKSELLTALNQQQKQAVTHKNGPLMIIAGAGTGKTSVITSRIAWLIEQKLALPEEILALTFTEKAATEMEERVDRLLPLGYLELSISTFHAFCEKLLRTYGLEIGIPIDFEIHTDIDALLLTRKYFEKLKLDYYKPKGNPSKFLKPLITYFSKLKDEGITCEQYTTFAKQKEEKVAKDASEDQVLEAKKQTELAHAYSAYQEILLANHALDFGDVINYCIELLKTRPNIQKNLQAQFKYILVDEFQDTNASQYELIKLLVNTEKNITIVGDDDQAIYQFRGASLNNILSFRSDFPKAKKVVLTKNYRSSKEILDQAYCVIQNNNPNRLEVQERLNKKLESQTDKTGIVEYYHCATAEEELQQIIEKIVALHNQGTPWKEIAILTRAGNAAEPLIELFDAIGLPYQFVGLSGLYTKPVILDVLAYLRVIEDPHNSPAMHRILSHPELGIGISDSIELAYTARKQGKTLLDSMKSAGASSNISIDGQTRIRELLNFLQTLQEAAKQKTAMELFQTIVKESGLLASIKLANEAEQQEQFGHLQQFLQRIKKFEKNATEKSVREFLDEFTHEREAGEMGPLNVDEVADHDSIQIMTIHASKGLEFDHVFLIQLVEQRFPSQKRKDPIEIPPELTTRTEQKDAHFEEERRLFYVALTRAKTGLYLYSANSYGGTKKRKPSRYLNELNIEPTAAQTITTIFDQPTETEQQPKSTEAQIQSKQSISFTAVDQFLTCPLKYKYNEILKIPVFGKHALSFGQTMHITLQRCMEIIKKQQNKSQTDLFQPANQPIQLPTKNECIQIYKDAWRDEWYPNEQTRNEYKRTGLAIISDFHKKLEQELPLIAELEKSFTLKIGKVTVKGRIDRMDYINQNEVEIIDYKTGTPKEKIDSTAKRQLILYQLAAENCFNPPLNVTKLSYYYLENNTKVSFTATEKQKQKLIDELERVGEELSTSTFKATPGMHCSYCDFRDICEFAIK